MMSATRNNINELGFSRIQRSLASNDNARSKVVENDMLKTGKAIVSSSRSTNKSRLATRTAIDRLNTTSAAGFAAVVKEQRESTKDLVEALTKVKNSVGGGFGGRSGPGGLFSSLFDFLGMGGGSAAKTAGGSLLSKALRIGGKVGGVGLGAGFSAFEGYSNKDSSSPLESYGTSALMGAAGGALVGGLPGAIIGGIANVAGTALGRNWDDISSLFKSSIKSMGEDAIAANSDAAKSTESAKRNVQEQADKATAAMTEALDTVKKKTEDFKNARPAAPSGGAGAKGAGRSETGPSLDSIPTGPSQDMSGAASASGGSSSPSSASSGASGPSGADTPDVGKGSAAAQSAFPEPSAENMNVIPPTGDSSVANTGAAAFGKNFSSGAGANVSSAMPSWMQNVGGYSSTTPSPGTSGGITSGSGMPPVAGLDGDIPKASAPLVPSSNGGFPAGATLIMDQNRSSSSASKSVEPTMGDSVTPNQAAPSATGANSSAGDIFQRRQKFASEINDPAVQNRFLALTMSENNTDRGRVAVGETIFNRADAHGNSLMDTMNRRYYEPMQNGSYERNLRRLENDPALRERLMKNTFDRVLNGSNESNFATHNSSAGVAANARRTQNVTSEITGETYSRKDRPEWSNLHGSGTTNKESKWFQGMMKAQEDAKTQQNTPDSTSNKSSPFDVGVPGLVGMPNTTQQESKSDTSDVNPAEVKNPTPELAPTEDSSSNNGEGTKSPEVSMNEVPSTPSDSALYWFNTTDVT